MLTKINAIMAGQQYITKNFLGREETNQKIIGLTNIIAVGQSLLYVVFSVKPRGGIFFYTVINAKYSKRVNKFYRCT